MILTYKGGTQSGLVVNRTKIIKVTCKMRKEIEKKRNEKKNPKIYRNKSKPTETNKIKRKRNETNSKQNLPKSIKKRDLLEC